MHNTPYFLLVVAQILVYAVDLFFTIVLYRMIDSLWEDVVYYRKTMGYGWKKLTGALLISVLLIFAMIFCIINMWIYSPQFLN